MFRCVLIVSRSQLLKLVGDVALRLSALSASPRRQWRTVWKYGIHNDEVSVVIFYSGYIDSSARGVVSSVVNVCHVVLDLIVHR